MTGRDWQAKIRKSPRVEVPAIAYVISRGEILGAYRVENLCAGGAVLAGGLPLMPGMMYRLVLELPGSRPLPLTGRVMRRQDNTHGDYCYGIAFSDVDAAVEDQLQDLVLSRLEQQHCNLPKVLVVDDSVVARKALSQELQGLGLSPLLAPMPLDALRLLLNKEVQIDIAIVDLYLGPADGYQLLKYMAKTFPAIRRILISGRCRLSQLELALSAGYAHAILPKPWGREQILHAIAA